MRLVFGVEEVEATLAEQLGRRVAQQPDHPLVDEAELAIHGVPRDEFGRAVRAAHLADVRRGGDLQTADGDQATVRRVHFVVALSLQLHACKHI